VGIGVFTRADTRVRRCNCACVSVVVPAGCSSVLTYARELMEGVKRDRGLCVWDFGGGFVVWRRYMLAAFFLQ
jgi:hypothetical protein